MLLCFNANTILIRIKYNRIRRYYSFKCVLSFKIITKYVHSEIWHFLKYGIWMLTSDKSYLCWKYVCIINASSKKSTCNIIANTVMIYRVINMVNEMVIICFVILTWLCQYVQYSFRYDLRIVRLLYRLFKDSAIVISRPFIRTVTYSCVLFGLSWRVVAYSIILTQVISSRTFGRQVCTVKGQFSLFDCVFLIICGRC